jgi:hypothetical protein
MKIIDVMLTLLASDDLQPTRYSSPAFDEAACSQAHSDVAADTDGFPPELATEGPATSMTAAPTRPAENFSQLLT